MWGVHHDVVLRIERTLADAGITIPFPQRVVHVVEPPAGLRETE